MYPHCYVNIADAYKDGAGSKLICLSIQIGVHILLKYQVIKPRNDTTLILTTVIVFKKAVIVQLITPVSGGNIVLRLTLRYSFEYSRPAGELYRCITTNNDDNDDDDNNDDDNDNDVDDEDNFISLFSSKQKRITKKS